MPEPQGEPAAAGGPARAAAAPPASLMRRLGVAEGTPDGKLAWRVVWAAVGVYALSAALFYPTVATNVDESMYLHQAALVLEGRATVEQTDPLTGEREEIYPSTYAPGMAILMAPLVWLAGERGAYAVPLLALLASVLLTARWLHDAGRSPVFALLLLGFLPALVMGRVAMSDVPSTAVVVLGLWLFWRGLDGPAAWWFASGVVAGTSLTLRVSNPLIFVPLFAGTVLRREMRSLALVAGGVVGLLIRMGAMAFYFGDPFFERGFYAFQPETILDRLPLYLFGLLVLVPGGLAFALLYRGPRRPEILTTFGLFLAFYLFQRFSSVAAGPEKRLVLSLRYFIPLVPLLAFAMAESIPRIVGPWLARAPAPSRGPRLAELALRAWLAGVFVAALAVHPALSRWVATQAEMRAEIARHVGNDDVLVTNWQATRKFLDPLRRRYVTLKLHRIEPRDVGTLEERHGLVYIVLVDRSDSEYWRKDAEANAAFLAALPVEQEVMVDRQVTATDRLRILRVGAQAPEAAPAERPGSPSAGSPTAS